MSDEIQTLLTLRKVTRALAEHLKGQMSEHLATLTPLLGRAPCSATMSVRRQGGGQARRQGLQGAPVAVGVGGGRQAVHRPSA